MRHGILEQPPQLLLLSLQLRLQARRQLEHALLGDGALDEGVNVSALEAEVLEPRGLVAQIGQEASDGLGEDLSRALALDVGDVDAEGLGGLQVAVRVGGRGEAEDGGGRDGDGDAVGDERVGHVVAGVHVAGVLAGDGVGHAWMGLASA